MKRSHGGAVDPLLLDFSQNVNFQGPPPAVLSVLADAASVVGRYPSPDAAALREALARKHGVSQDCILAGNGSCELIYLAAALFRGAKGRVLTPAFTEYEDACEAYGISVGEGAPVVTFVGNPTSPQGLLRPRAEVLSLPGVLVVDEAFIDFAAERESLLRDASSDPRLIVLRSLTKFYALPGLRIGFAVSAPETIRRLKALQPPWSVNALAQGAGVAAIHDRAYAERSIRELPTAREELRQGLYSLGIESLPSEANYLLCRVPDVAALERALKKRGIAIRNCDSFTGLEKNRFFRVAVRAPEDNQRLIKALEEIRTQR